MEVKIFKRTQGKLGVYRKRGRYIKVWQHLPFIEMHKYENMSQMSLLLNDYFIGIRFFV